MWGWRDRTDAYTGCHGNPPSNLVVLGEALGESLRISRREKMMYAIPNYNKKIILDDYL